MGLSSRVGGLWQRIKDAIRRPEPSGVAEADKVRVEYDKEYLRQGPFM